MLGQGRAVPMQASGVQELPSLGRHTEPVKLPGPHIGFRV